ncbi:MAG: efflux RND transporter periplasmic adaptor subunit [Bacteroidales bacterium]|nr:efflux RND transporter periplasmic adaptor subunit [Bacteroidales bacterium]MCI7315158.1 efflux RND transporter periplasmic adaptor subunit [Bacteroidales bacterium]MDD6583849.1 efflux RND transporter periplasmic adaptor subunit [Bacteroidales bacterium]
MKLNRKTVGIVLAVVAVAGVAAYFMLHGGKSQVQVNFETAKVEKATIGSSITATGTIEAVTTVEVGTQVSGIIDKIYVDYNSPVKRGQVIAELDKTNLVSELNSANSNLQGARSDLNYQQANYNRQRTLFEKGLISANDFESARLALEQAQSVLSQRQEAVNKARTNLGYATITSPIDGIVLSKAVEEGQTVASSFNTPTLFTIVKDMTDMRVIADVDEADIGEVREGQRVTYTVDAYPSEVFQGTVTQVRNEATTTNNVVTYEVVISAPNPDLKLKPGLTANVTVYTLEQPNVVSVPSKALRFTPTKEMLQPGQKIVDCNAKKKLWVREGNTFKAYGVSVGISNGTRTQIVSGIKEGTEVIVDIAEATDQEGADPSAAAASQEKSPFAPSRPGKKK